LLVNVVDMAFSLSVTEVFDGNTTHCWMRH